ncbi:low affinity iron permease family protein [Chitinimonas arctica]|uniref:Low affinity iron permease family protein n=1 Tax=Chitinimonas arctica TaxID=2594795 RepID=A0A516SLA5_9NEIS|nr:low affinity iron permease family protein [Chitinimonas arctica]QDQ28798.1 low affinity iron permease family protein [Chitinimonas arctica]
MSGKKVAWFTQLAKQIASFTGKPVTFSVALGLVLVWAISGPMFDFSDTWQLVINTSTTIITFLMVFLIQNTQNRDTEALQIKLDELIYSLEESNNALLDLEELDEEQLDKIRQRYVRLAKKTRAEADEEAEAPQPE